MAILVVGYAVEEGQPPERRQHPEFVGCGFFILFSLKFALGLESLFCVNGEKLGYI